MSLSFKLTKWYMDVVSEDGEVVIVHAAELDFAALHLSGVHVLHARGNHVKATSSLRRAWPTLDGEGKTLTWQSSALDAEGTWKASAPPIRETLLEEEAGGVTWNCAMPAARAVVRLRGGRVVEGFGYAEEISVTLAPWDLPIDELRWGRFGAEGRSLVWLEWKGPQTKSFFIKDGNRLEGVIDGSAVVLSDGARLEIAEGRVLRDGTLGSGVLSAICELYPLLPAKLLATVERKECARATLIQPHREPASGWAIHQVVRWG